MKTSLSSSVLEGSIFISHKVGEFDELVGVGPLIIVPANEFDESWVELNGST